MRIMCQGCGNPGPLSVPVKLELVEDYLLDLDMKCACPECGATGPLREFVREDVPEERNTTDENQTAMR